MPFLFKIPVVDLEVGGEYQSLFSLQSGQIILEFPIADLEVCGGYESVFLLQSGSIILKFSVADLEVGGFFQGGAVCKNPVRHPFDNLIKRDTWIAEQLVCLRSVA